MKIRVPIISQKKVVDKKTQQPKVVPDEKTGHLFLSDRFEDGKMRLVVEVELAGGERETRVLGTEVVGEGDNKSISVNFMPQG